jgi:hypothetical protein
MANGSSEGNSAVGAAANLIDRLGLMDLVIPAVRSRLKKIDTEALIDDVFDYVQRNPEILVVIFGSLTITSGLIVYLVRKAEEEEREERERERRREREEGDRPRSSSSKSRKRRTAERKE